MSNINAESDDFFPYITKIVSRGKVCYNNKPFENRLENKLFNIIMNEKMDFNIEEITANDFVPDCSLSTGRGHTIVIDYLRNPFCTQEGTKFLVEHGADASAAYEYMEQCYAAKDCIVSYNWKYIFSYLKYVLKK